MTSIMEKDISDEAKRSISLYERGDSESCSLIEHARLCDHGLQAPHQSKQRFGRATIAAAVHASIFCIYVVLGPLLMHDWDPSPTCKSHAGESGFYSPAKEAIVYEVVKFKSGLHDTNVCRGNPRPELDAAWVELLSGVTIRIDEEAVIKTGMNLSTAADLADGGYMSELDVFHQLHCLRVIRMAWTPELYPKQASQIKPDPKKGELIPYHIDHCLDHLRQVVMCKADTALDAFDWVDWYDRPWMRFDVEHECVNWDRLFQWSKKHHANMRNGNLIHPTKGPVDVFADGVFSDMKIH